MGKRCEEDQHTETHRGRGRAARRRKGRGGTEEVAAGGGHVQSARKFSTVFGTVLPYSPITMRPDSLPPIEMSKYTLLVTVGPAAAAAVSESARRAMTRVAIFHVYLF